VQRPCQNKLETRGVPRVEIGRRWMADEPSKSSWRSGTTVLTNPLERWGEKRKKGFNCPYGTTEKGRNGRKKWEPRKAESKKKSTDHRATERNLKREKKTGDKVAGSRAGQADERWAKKDDREGVEDIKKTGWGGNCPCLQRPAPSTKGVLS